MRILLLSPHRQIHRTATLLRVDNLGNRLGSLTYLTSPTLLCRNIQAIISLPLIMVGFVISIACIANDVSVLFPNNSLADLVVAVWRTLLHGATWADRQAKMFCICARTRLSRHSPALHHTHTALPGAPGAIHIWDRAFQLAGFNQHMAPSTRTHHCSPRYIDIVCVVI